MNKITKIILLSGSIVVTDLVLRNLPSVSFDSKERDNMLQYICILEHRLEDYESVNDMREEALRMFPKNEFIRYWKEKVH